MTPPSSVTELSRFMGMVNQMTKFSQNIAQISEPPRELLSSKNAWSWKATLENSFSKLKAEISSPRVLDCMTHQMKLKLVQMRLLWSRSCPSSETTGSVASNCFQFTFIK